MIKFSKHNILESDYSLVKKIMKSGWLTHGPYTKIFEEEFKKYTRSKYAVCVSSCTAGLHLSCIALNFKKGDEIIVTSTTHTATAHSIEYTGATPIFVDVDFPSGNIKVSEIKKKITKKTKGIIIVHMAGQPCDIDKIQKLCKQYRISLIEDCAHALGSEFRKKHVGNFGKTGCFSFYPTKQITTGEGGMIITNDFKVYDKLKKLRAFGIDTEISKRKKPGQYDVKMLGLNYRMTDFQAALGISQIKNYKMNLSKRKLIAERYISNFKNSKVKFLNFDSNSSYFVFQIFVKNRDNVLKMLAQNKIGCSIHYLTPVPLMKYYRNKYNLKKSDFKNSSDYGKFNISLPVYPKLKLSEVDRISKKILEFIK